MTTKRMYSRHARALRHAYRAVGGGMTLPTSVSIVKAIETNHEHLFEVANKCYPGQVHADHSACTCGIRGCERAEVTLAGPNGSVTISSYL